MRDRSEVPPRLRNLADRRDAVIGRFPPSPVPSLREREKGRKGEPSPKSSPLPISPSPFPFPLPGHNVRSRRRSHSTNPIPPPRTADRAGQVAEFQMRMGVDQARHDGCLAQSLGAAHGGGTDCRRRQSGLGKWSRRRRAAAAQARGKDPTGSEAMGLHVGVRKIPKKARRTK